jgi:hypothetical protein
MRKFFFLAAALVFPSLSAAPAWAWGCSGHEIVALIAHEELQTLDAEHRTRVLPEVERLLALQDRNYPHRYCGDLNLDPMAFWATWADDHRVVDPATGPWHYWDIPLAQPSAASVDQYCAEGCVVKALQNEIAILRDKTRPDAERSTALLWVLHLVGDMHQPLHEEDNNDRGGNCVPVSFLDHKAEQRPNGSYGPNLHGVWDTDLVELAGGIDRKSPNAAAQVKGFAEQLDRESAAAIHREERETVDLIAWANQAHGMARSEAYPQLQPPIAPVEAPVPGSSCETTAAMYFARHETADATYIERGRSAVELLLPEAGARLADVLYTSLR